MQDTQVKTNGQLSSELSSLHLQLKNIEERDNLLLKEISPLVWLSGLMAK